MCTHRSDRVMNQLMALLNEDELDMIVKPDILNTIGDIAMNMEDDQKNIHGRFDKYLPTVLKTFQTATLIEIDENDPIEVEFKNALFEGLLDAYSIILQITPRVAKPLPSLSPPLPSPFPPLLTPTPPPHPTHPCLISIRQMTLVYSFCRQYRTAFLFVKPICGVVHLFPFTERPEPYL